MVADAFGSLHHKQLGYYGINERSQLFVLSQF